MKSTAEQLNINITDYLEGELISEIKHEYINGDVYAMAGAKRTHNLVSMNLSALLYILRAAKFSVIYWLFFADSCVTEIVV